MKKNSTVKSSLDETAVPRSAKDMSWLPLVEFPEKWTDCGFSQMTVSPYDSPLNTYAPGMSARYSTVPEFIVTVPE